MPYGGTAPELEPPEDEPLEDAPPPLDDVPDDPPLVEDPEDEAPDEPPDDDVEDDDELDVSSLPPHAAIAVALANKIAARVATRPVGGAGGVNAGSAASQNGHDASLARTCRLQSGQGLRLATRREYQRRCGGYSIFGVGLGDGIAPASATGGGPYTVNGISCDAGGGGWFCTFAPASGRASTAGGPADFPHAVSAVAPMSTIAARVRGRPVARGSAQTPKSSGKDASQNGHDLSLDRT